MKTGFPHGEQHLNILSRLLLGEGSISAIRRQHEPAVAVQLAGIQELAIANHQELEEFLELANTHHVVLRALGVVRQVMAGTSNHRVTDWAAGAMEREEGRIARALAFLETICGVLESEGCAVKVIKSLDHLPDLGSDLDLYTGADAGHVVQVMQRRFEARVAARSVGDRLANKWNFIVPGLNEAVEIHVGRLGQTGEQVGIARSLATRGGVVRLGQHTFQVPVAEDRVMITTLQRMYRHFYLRLCDIVDTAELFAANAVDCGALREAASEWGIWTGTATFLAIVSDYVRCYRDRGLSLPDFVTSAAEFGGERVRFGQPFLRVPIAPESLRLYASELGTLLMRGQLRSVARLSTLPCLATAAALEYKITGSDKGIW